ncbi:MAG: long-chain fatty acid--CoA ligase [Bacteroidales bacterium]|nr:long-chain fatty acid--CoA ligase [Bacteroidales bacterium]MDY6075724.1 long-chain fatty acid--CoA ligase [Bacteroidales bacterium]
MEEKRIFDILTSYMKKYPEQDTALAKKENGEWRRYSIQEYVNTTNIISFALIKIGIKKNDKVAIISSNRPEWNILDMAIQKVGAITVPIYPTISKDDYKIIINNCEAKLAIIEGLSVLSKIEEIRPEIPSIEHIYTFVKRSEQYPIWDDLISLGKENVDFEELERRESSILPSDCATIIYTSGTTGIPKGVMLSHSNILGQIENLRQTPSKDSTRALSFLPLCHAYERTLVYLYQYLGMSVYYSESIATIAQEMKEIHPTMMTCVPRLLEKIYLKVKQTGNEKKGLARIIFRWAMQLAEKYTVEGRSKLYDMKLRIADKLVYRKIREKLGSDCFDIIVSGAASLQPNISAFFSAIKMPVYEGYGMTECSPVIATSSNVPHGREAGFVGPALPGIEIKISETGEIMCRGHNVMLGYYKLPELTAEVIDNDGWFHTGDLGEFNQYGLLKITGRMKNLFKTSLGKYINPDIIERKFTESNFFENIVVFGENEKYAAALIIPDFEFIKSWCKKHEISYTNDHDMLNNQDVKTRLANEIKRINSFFGDTEKIKRYCFIEDSWTVANGILTPTLKVKRSVVKEKYSSLINKLFHAED